MYVLFKIRKELQHLSTYNILWRSQISIILSYIVLFYGHIAIAVRMSGLEEADKAVAMMLVTKRRGWQQLSSSNSEPQQQQHQYSNGH